MAYPRLMKIIGGERKGHTIVTPEGLKTRPTLSRVRESLFSIIAGDVPGSIFCELFAGTGSIGLEALSRGAEKAILVEIAREPFECLRKSVANLRYTDRATLVNSDVFRWKLPAGAASPDIIFADPPYDEPLIERFMEKLEQWELKPDTLIIVQTPKTYTPRSGFKHLRTATYGLTALHFYLSGPQGASANEDQLPTEPN